MNKGDEVIYRVAVTGLKDNVAVRSASDHLKRCQVGLQHQYITTHEDGTPGSINVPRLYTIWQGDEVEIEWQNNVRSLIGKVDCTVIIEVSPWIHASGYPKDTMTKEAQV